jgi:hypothetical protein
MQLINIMRFSSAQSNVNGAYLHVTICRTWLQGQEVGLFDLEKENLA